MRAITYDPKCYELAEHFLQDEEPWLNQENAKVELARLIQRCVEDQMNEWLKNANG